MKILLMHRNFPAQFIHIASALGKMKEHQVLFLTGREDAEMEGVQKIVYKRLGAASSEIHPYLRSVEDTVLDGQAAAEAAIKLREQGFIPDLIYGASGWGPTLYMKDIFPKTPMLGYFEWFYNAHGADVDFGVKSVKADDEARLRIKNAPILLDLQACDRGICPTYWQHSQFPPEYAQKISVLHDGIDTDECCPKATTGLSLPQQGIDLTMGEEIITYVGRGMEPYRGFPQFMHALELVLKRRPKAHAVIVGNEGSFYSAPPSNGKSFKEIMLERLDLDLNRVHFTGPLSRELYLKVLQASSTHVYLTVPFVLSWSFLEAMSCGCSIVASSTKPVMEVVNDGVNGYLVNMLSPTEIAAKVEEALENKTASKVIGYRARETVLERYSLMRLLPRHFQIMNEVVMNGRME